MIAFAAAAPQQQLNFAEVLRDDRDVRPDGYSFALETSDGIIREEEGHALPESGALAQSGRIE